MDLTTDPPPPHTVRPPNGVMLRGDGRVSVTRRGASTLICQLVGSVEPPHLRWLLTELDRHLAHDVRDVFVDASRVHGDRSGVARALIEWCQRPGTTLRSIHVLDRSSEPGTESSAVGDHEGDVRHHDDEASFQSALIERIG